VDQISLSSSALPRGARVVGFKGDEAISRPYRFEVFVTLGDADELPLDAAIGARARLTIDPYDGKHPAFAFTGIVASVELLHAHAGSSLLRVVIVPRLFLLGLSRHSRVFTKASVPSILLAIFESNGLGPDDVELRLGSYDDEEHVCQYRESDLDFVSRWMEREGIYYYFEHGDEVEKLIVCDAHAYADDLLGRPVRYVPESGKDVSAGPCFRSFTYLETTLPASVKLKDYDYGHPSLSLVGAASVSPQGKGEVSLYGERFFTPAAGERLARTRAEELLAQRVTARAQGTRTHLRSGHVFELDEHPRAELNTRYLTIEAHHEGNYAAGNGELRQRLGLAEDSVYHVTLGAIPASTQFRAPSRVPWPRIYGYENGVIDGEAQSVYAQIDEHGRYKVRLSFDERALASFGSSTFVRMMQPHGGGVEGFHFPLRKGTEVVVSFLGGDPDRPVIAGVVPNAFTPSPVTGTNHTTNVIQTGGYNRIEIEDQAGSERIVISTPHANSYLRIGEQGDQEEITAFTEKDIRVDAQRNLELKAGQGGGGDMTTLVKDAMITTVERGNQETTVTTGDLITTVTTGDLTTTVTTGNMDTTVMSGTQTAEVEGAVTETYHDTQSTTVTHARTLKADVVEHFVKTREARVVGDAGFTGVNEALSAAGWNTILYSGALSSIVLAGPITQSASGLVKITSTASDVEIEGTSVNITSRADLVTTNTGKKIELSFSDANTFAYAATSTLTIGGVIDAFIGAKLSLALSASVDITVGTKMAICAAVGLDTKVAQFEAINTKIKAGASDFEICGLKLIL
jgi:type VI secretion system secreted protein VgrG